MAQNSNNQDYTNNADGFTLGGGTSKRKLSITGSDINFIGTGNANFTLPSADDTLLGVSKVDTDAALAANSDAKIASQKATKAYVDSQPKAPGSYKYPTALQTFWDGLNNGTANTVFFGDSITYGFGVSWKLTYPQLFNSKIMARYGGVQFSWLPADGISISINDSDRGISSTGSPTKISSGLGAASVAMTNSGDSLTWTTKTNCTVIEVWYKKGASQGNMSISVDGGTVTTIDTGAASLSWGNKWTSGTLTSGIHTITVSPATGGSFNASYQAEVEAFGLDPVTTPRVYNASRFGIGTAGEIDFTTTNPHADDSLNAIDPRLVVVNLGTNNLGAGSGYVPTYKSYLEALITRLSSLPSGAPAVVLVKLPLNGTTTDLTAMQPWWTAIDELATSHSNVIVWDLYNLMGDCYKNLGGLFQGVVGAGGVHPSTAGNDVMADSLAKLVLPPYYSTGSNLGNVSGNLTGNVTGNLTGNVTGNLTGNVTGNLTGDVSGRINVVVEELTASVTLAVAQLGKILVYNGTTDITVTYDQTALSLAAYAYSLTTFVQLNTGRITIAASGAFSTSGQTSTNGISQRLLVGVPAVGTFAKVVCTLVGGASTGTTVPRVNTLTAASNVYTINTDTTDVAVISSPAANFTVQTSGTPVDGQKVQLRISNGATGYTPTWNAIFISSGLVILPSSAYPASKTNIHGFVYDANKTKWVLIALDPAGY